MSSVLGYLLKPEPGATAEEVELTAKTPGLSADQALLLAVTQYIASGGGAEGVPGKPGEPIPPGVPPSEGIGDLPDMQVPGQSAEVPQPGGIPGQENTRPADGTTTTSPMPEEQGPGLIFSEGPEATSTGKIVIDRKIGGQLAERGWSEQDVKAVINKGSVGSSMDNRSATKTPDGLPRNDPASVYGSKNGYIVVNDRTGEIVQVSDKTDPDWIVDGRINWH